MSDSTMSDRVELSEALRHILEDPYSESEMDDHKENLAKVGASPASPRAVSRRNGIKSRLTPINKASTLVRTGCSPRPVLATSADKSNRGTLHDKRRKVGFEDERSPPKKRRHANHVIILRQPKNKTKQQKSLPKWSPGRGTQLALSEDLYPTDKEVKLSCSNKEFTVELDSGVVGLEQDSDPNAKVMNHSIQGTVNNTPNQNAGKVADAVSSGQAICMSTPPRAVQHGTPDSAQKCLEAAIESQIKLEPSEEELESGLPALDGLDLTASPLCHFTDAGQQQLYSELSALETEGLEGNAWPANQEEALLQLAASQQMLQCAGNFCFDISGQPFLPREGPLGRWVTRGGNADDSLTNITWLKRMSAPDLDPNTLQTARMMDPRFERPTYSYSTLIQFAISSSKTGKMTLREIYTWIEETFPYFKTAKAGWRNSIRHNLSLHKIFVREPPISHGQPAFWTLRPGTVVHLPERRMYVADPERGGTLLEEVAPPTPPMVQPTVGSEQQQGAPLFMGGAMPPVVMVPRPLTGMASDISSKDFTGTGSKTKKPPLILPRGSQPYALVPVPLLVPSSQNGGQTPSDGQPQAVPHILSPIIMGGFRRFATLPQTVGGRRVVPIAPKVNPVDRGCGNLSWSVSAGSVAGGGNTSLCNTSSGSDSGVDLSGRSWTSSLASSSAAVGSRVPGTSNGDLPHQTVPGQGRSSLPSIQEDTDETEGDDSFSAFFERELASPPQSQPNLKGVPVVSTPCKQGNLHTLLSPLRGFTPFKNPPLDPDSGIFHDLPSDLSLTPGLTPNYKSSQRGSVRGQRSRVGSLGDLGLPGLTPEKGSLSSDGVHNQSFGQIFGDLVGLDMEGDGLDVGNISWSMFSPGKQHMK
ncbi:forkhead box protein M1-like [Acanthaster planci]|uniref:Forkhead box protein M1-like n=1 Tax=Acanthaster planci TaxID=133434 RepID=A0A8B7Y9X2_ACAPL|nr:forkhead box protein M1-like [Acanthaster planci]XP_022089170.1 forkhead box protein M1-like [Acanthaster planci]